MKLVKVVLVATVLAFTVGCASQKPAPAPAEPVMAPAPVVEDIAKHKKKHKRKHKDKLGAASVQQVKDTDK